MKKNTVLKLAVVGGVAGSICLMRYKSKKDLEKFLKEEEEYSNITTTTRETELIDYLNSSVKLPAVNDEYSRIIRESAEKHLDMYISVLNSGNAEWLDNYLETVRESCQLEVTKYDLKMKGEA